MYSFTRWPAEPQRLNRYRRYEQLYRGEHHKAFAERVNMKLYKMARKGMGFLELDYPRTIVDIPADLLVGASPVISYRKAHLNDALKRVMDRSRFDSILREAVQDAGFRGDALFVVRQSVRGVVVEPKPAYTYFPEIDCDNCREALTEQLAWMREYNGEKILRVDRYLPGAIAREAYRLIGNEVGPKFTGSKLVEILQGPPIVPTGIEDRNTLVHFPNVRSSNSFLGISDYDGGLHTLFEEIDVRATQISQILDRHADPKMSGPPLRLPPGANGTLDFSTLNYFPVGSNDASPEYVTWDAQLQAAFQQYKNLADEIFRHSGICPMLAGYVTGARYDSGRAFRMQLAPTLLKVSRKALYLEPAVKETLRLAVAMELGLDYEDVDAPNIRWRDGLPKDLAQDSQTENNRIASQTTSRLDAIRRLDDCDEETALAVLDQIEAEQQRFGGVKRPPEIQTSETEEPADELEAVDESEEDA